MLFPQNLIACAAEVDDRGDVGAALDEIAVELEALGLGKVLETAR